MNDQAATLRLAVFPRSGVLVDVLLAFGGAAFVGLAAQVSRHLGFTPVPIGSVLGAASMSIYLLLGIAGVPWYSEQKHGWEVFSGATGGYIVGFVLAAAVTGQLSERGWDKKFSSSIAAMLTGSVIIYACGSIWLHHELHVSWNTAFVDGVYPFIPGDIVKLYLAAAALPGAWAVVRRLRSTQ